MAVVACGLNANSQIVPVGPPLLCCPTPVKDKKDVCEVHITCSHILWKINVGWQITGYKNYDYSLEKEMEQGWKISASEMRIAAIKNDGAVVLREKGKWRKLFFQRDTAMDSRNIGPSVQLIEDQDNIAKSESDEHHTTSPTKLSSVYVEDNSLIALDEGGKLYSSGVPVPYGGCRISAVELGKEHCMALTTDGVVLTWGSGMRGQLGNGELCQIDRPEPVESLQGITISSIASGGWHCVALSTSGDAYTWGWNESGPTGHFHSSPRCMRHHCVALSTSGDAYTWGWNESGQLGFPAKADQEASVLGTFSHSCQCPKPVHKTDTVQDDTNVREIRAKEPSNDDQLASPEGTGGCRTDPRINGARTKDVVNVQTSPRLLDFWNEDMAIIDVKCGDRHTLYQLEDGSVWSTGMNKYGQLGLGDTAERNEPCLVPVKGVRTMFAGGWISVFVTTDASGR